MTSSLRERLYRTEAIVLSRMDFGEADRIITVFTSEYGKMRVIAKGVRRPTSRFGPHLEYFCRCNLMLARGRELDVVTGVETIDAHVELRTDLDAFGHASHLVELVNRLTEDRQEAKQLYELLARSLKLLSDGVDPFGVARHFELTLLTLLGFRPELFQCVHCQQEIQAVPNPLSSAFGGMLCETCRHLDGSTPLLSVNAQKYLRMLERQGLSTAIRLQLDDRLRNELEGALSAYLRYVAERDLTSLRIWHQLQEPSDNALLREVESSSMPSTS